MVLVAVVYKEHIAAAHMDHHLVWSDRQRRIKAEFYRHKV